MMVDRPHVGSYLLGMGDDNSSTPPLADSSANITSPPISGIEDDFAVKNSDDRFHGSPVSPTAGTPVIPTVTTTTDQPTVPAPSSDKEASPTAAPTEPLPSGTTPQAPVTPPPTSPYPGQLNDMPAGQSSDLA